jgi:hypothetical protein
MEGYLKERKRLQGLPPEERARLKEEALMEFPAIFRLVKMVNDNPEVGEMVLKAMGQSPDLTVLQGGKASKPPTN